jgi:Flp pilus assembly protein TadD
MFMSRKTFTAGLASMALVLSLSIPCWHALSAAGVDLCDPDVETGAAEQPRKSDDGVGRVLGAPFRAFGRLFGGGKKRNRLERPNEKDIKKFESAQSSRVKDARTQVAPAAPAGENSAADHLQRGRELLSYDQLNEAIAELSTAASLDPKSGETHTLLGVAYDRKGLPDRALQSFEAALHSPDDQAMHLNNIGFLEYKQGEYDKAVKYLKRAVKVAPNDQRIWNNLGLAQVELGKFDDAYKSFAHSMGEFDAHLRIANRLEQSGHANEAIKHLEKALALQPNSTTVLTRLAGLYEQTGRDERAERARRALKPSTAAEARAGRD